MKLSSLLSHCPSLFDDKKISVVDKGLTDVDFLPRHFHHVKVVTVQSHGVQVKLHLRRPVAAKSMPAQLASVKQQLTARLGK